DDQDDDVAVGAGGRAQSVRTCSLRCHGRQRGTPLRYASCHHGQLKSQPVSARRHRLTPGLILSAPREAAVVLSAWLLVGFGVLLTAGTAIFVAAEFALVTLDPGVVEQQTAGRSDRRSQGVRKALATL